MAFQVNQPRRTIYSAIRDQILAIPLFIKRPGQTTGGTSDRHVETIDILPSIADVLGITLKLPVDGRSVFRTQAAERTHTTYCNVRDELERIPVTDVGVEIAHTIARRFGDARDPEALYRIGPAPALVGRPVAGIPTIEQPPLQLELLEQPANPSRATVAFAPCYLEGQIRSRLPIDRPVSLAVSEIGRAHV